MVATTSGSRTPVTPRQAFSVVNGGQDPATRSGPGSIAGSDCGGIEFTREEVEGELSIEHERLKKMFELAEKKSNDMEMLMNAKEDELNSIITELRTNYADLQDKFTKEEADKLAAIQTLMTEKDARLSAERSQASLTEDLNKSLRESSSANQKIISLNDLYKRLQEYNTSLQQYNSKLQTELNQTSETLKNVEREKAALTENLSNLRGYHDAQQDQLINTKASLEETTKLKDGLVSEVGCLRGDLQQVRDDRDRQLVFVQELTAEVMQYKECTGKFGEAFSEEPTPKPASSTATQPSSSSAPKFLSSEEQMNDIQMYFLSGPQNAEELREAQRKQQQRAQERNQRAQERQQKQVQEGKRRLSQAKKKAKKANMIIMKNTDHRVQTLGQPDSVIVKKSDKFINQLCDRSGIRIWGYSGAKKLYFVRKNSGRIEYYEKKVDFMSFTRIDLQELVAAQFYNPSNFEQAYHFRNLLVKSARNNFKELKLAKPWVHTYQDVTKWNSHDQFKNVFRLPTKKVQHVPLNRPLPNGALTNFEYWAYDHTSSTVVIRLRNNQQFRLIGPNDLLMFDESDIRKLASHQIIVFDDAHEGCGKEFTSMVAKIIENRLGTSAREDVDIHLVPPSPEHED